MYLSIGNDMVVRDKSIIGIFDLDNTSTSKRTREFLEKCEKDGKWFPVMTCRNPLCSPANTDLPE